MRPRAVRALALAAALLAAGSVGAADAVWFPVRTNPWFADVRQELQALVDENGHRPVNRICVVGQTVHGTVQAYVHWPEENKLILWEPSTDDHRAVLHSRRSLDLTYDVVAGDDVHGSTYILTRTEADADIAACKKHGTTYVVTRKVRGQRLES